MQAPFFKSYDMIPAVSEERLSYLRAKVKELMEVPQPDQRTPEWYVMRDGMLTASDWGTILGENHYEEPAVILHKKCNKAAEQFTGNAATRWGQKYESVAIQIYERRNRVKVIEFGLIRHPEHAFLGASPDGITDDGVMVEIKCPSSRQITGVTPRHYWCQVQAQLEVCRLDRCDFLECELEEYISADAYFADSVFVAPSAFLPTLSYYMTIPF